MKRVMQLAVILSMIAAPVFTSEVTAQAEYDNNQVTAGQTLMSIKFSANYNLSKNLTSIFFYDHNFSEFAISTAFPQTSIRSGITIRYNFGN